MKYEVPCPPPRPSQLRWSFRQYFGVKDSKLCTGASIRPNFFRFFFSIFFWIISFCYSLLFLLPFSISSYSSLLILLFLSLLILLVGGILRLLFLFLLYFKLFVVLQTCILMIYVQFLYTFPSFWGVFEGPRLFYLLILFYWTIFFLFLFFSSYNLTVCCITDMHIKQTLGRDT